MKRHKINRKINFWGNAVNLKPSAGTMPGCQIFPLSIYFEIEIMIL